MNKSIIKIALIFALAAPLAFAGVIAPEGTVKADPSSLAKLEAYIKAIYAESGVTGLRYDIFRLAMVGYFNLKARGKLQNERYICVIDYDRPSTEKRLYILDLVSKKVLFNTWVAHGKYTGENIAIHFSNDPQSFMSSLGFFVTANTYRGKHGYSLVLLGMEEGINDNAKKRAIVIHGADYVSQEFINNVGRIGRSWGCPAVPVPLSKPIIDTIRNGTCVFCYFTDKAYLESSNLQNIQIASLEYAKNPK